MQTTDAHGKSLLIVGALAIATCGASAIGLRAGLTSDIPMTAEFRNDVQTPDRIMSDGLGLYIDRVDQVKAILDARGDFDLDTNTAGGPAFRRLVLDFTSPASCPAAGCQPPFATGAEDAYLSTGAGGLPAMPVGAAVGSTLAVNFYPGGDLQWFLRFNPSQYPDTSNVVVTRLSADTWAIEAGSNAIAKLLSAPTKGKMVLTDRGNFFMPFRAVVRRK